MLNLETKIEKLVGVGPKMTQRLNNLGLEKIKDLLFYFPKRYDDFSQISKISQVKIGEKNTILGKILEIKNQRSPKRRMFLTHALISDNSGALKILWFNQPWLFRILKKGDNIIASGKVKWKAEGVTLESPIFEKISELDQETVHTGRIVPVYSETEGLTSKILRKIIKKLLPLSSRISDFLPDKIKKSQDLINLDEALRQIHFPESQDTLKEAKKRLSFDELFLIQTRMLLTKKELENYQAPKIKINEKLCQDFVKSLPYKLTNAQRKAAWEILKDLEKSKPMNRLLNGDVGSGKTVVAALSALNTINSGYQVAFMAPTEILAFQHYKTLCQFLKPFNIKIGLLTSSQKLSTSNLKPLTSNLVIGTHALIQKDVKFKNLGLIIVDEQHRFGVKQRAALRQRTENNEQRTVIPHFLSMTATPIPRSLALTLYGDLDLSILDEMPPGRPKIITKVVAPTARKKAYSFISDQIQKGFQCFVICPLISESPHQNKFGAGQAEKLQVKAAEKEYEKLKKEIFPKFKIGLIHGKIKSKEKEKIMKSFSEGKLDILVATPVVEVGIDVPKATVMMIEGGERFGLASLHQFRGRVGRREHKSFCLIFAETWSEETRRRLKAFKESEDGFILAEKDLEIRGPGEIYGTRQHGLPDLKMASLYDIILIQKAKEEAKKIVNKGIENYPGLVKKIEEFEIERHLE